MKEMVREAYYYAQRPFDVPVLLPSISTHYNVRTLPPSFAPELLYDPSGRWAGRLQGPGPQLLFGMRGCGKTILLRSLEWPARLRPRKTSGSALETPQDVAQRVTDERFLPDAERDKHKCDKQGVHDISTSHASSCFNSVFPEVLESAGCQFGLADRMLNILAAEVKLNRPRMRAGVRQIETVG